MVNSQQGHKGRIGNYETSHSAVGNKEMVSREETWEEDSQVNMTLEALEDEGVSPGEPREVGRGEKSQVWGLRLEESTESVSTLHDGFSVC